MDIFSIIYNFAIVALIFFGLIIFLLYFFQNNIIYIPVIMGSGIEKSSNNNPKGYRNPGEKNLPFDNVIITTEDGIKLHGWFIKQNDLINKEVPTIIFFHENAGNIGTRLDYLYSYYHGTKYNILIIAYRGYSDSEGKPTEIGIQLDSKAILKYIFEERMDINTSKVFLHGRSLGGAVVNYVATHTNYPIAGIIFENTFTSISDLIDIMFPNLAFMKRFIQRNFWPSIDNINKIKTPIFFIMAMKDEIVPPVQMMRLFEKASNAKFKDKYVIADGMHNTNWSLDPLLYFNNIKSFVERCLC